MYVIIVIMAFVLAIIAVIVFYLEEKKAKRLGHIYWLRMIGMEESACLIESSLAKEYWVGF